MGKQGRGKMRYDVNDVAIAAARKLTQLDFVANNVANVSTPGFKAEHLYYAMKGKAAQENAHIDLGPTATSIDFAQGTSNRTGNKFDLTIEGDGFFTIQTKQGIAYTRNGSFLLNKNNELITPAGEYVLGETGNKIVVAGESVHIDGDGSIQVDGSSAGKLKITAFSDSGDISRAAAGQYVASGKAGPKKADNYNITSGYLEMSNVNAVKEMVDMMDIQRTFEMYQKIILTIADCDKISTSRIGKLV
jgi:flagellar basal-body rod protein FlgF